jgi:hypothetical protein
MGSKDFDLYSRDFVIAGFFTIEKTTEGFRIKFLTAEASLFKGTLFRGFTVFENASLKYSSRF